MRQRNFQTKWWTMIENSQERRRDIRVTFRALARLHFPGGRIFKKCETSDISISGVFVIGVSGVARGERCGVEFHLIGRTSSLVLEMAGEVIRVADGGVALQFYDVDQDSFCHLQNIVFFNYQQAGQLGAPQEEPAIAVDDETVYRGIAEAAGLPVLADDPGTADPFAEEYGDDLDLDFVDRVGTGQGDDD